MPNIEYLGLASAERSGLYGPGPLWTSPICEKIEPASLPFLDELCHAYDNRLQGIRPDRNYYWHHRRFLADFVDRPEVAVRDTPELMLVGFPNYFDRVEPVVKASREAIATVSGRVPKKIAVFIGDGITMDERYRAIGVDEYPYSYAIAGALDAYINTNLIDGLYGSLLRQRDPDRPAVKRAIEHEPKHPLWQSVFVDENGNPTWQLDKSKIVSEAITISQGQDVCSDVDTSRIRVVDYTPLEETLDHIVRGQPVKDNLINWLNTTAERNNTYIGQPLNDPTWALFFQWASQKGDQKYWYELAKKLL